MKIINAILSVAVAVALLLTGCAIGKDGQSDSSSSLQTASEALPVIKPDKSLTEKLRYIVHGGGALTAKDDYGYERSFAGSSSLEGITACAAAGVTAIELDFNFTSDGHLACVHHWGNEYHSSFSADAPPTLEEFLKCKIYNNFTSICLDDVAQFMRENPEIVIITDIKDRNVEGSAYIAKNAPDLVDRFIIQIYDKSEYQDVRSYGFDNIIYTLYALNWNEKNDFATIGKFARSNPLVGITFDHSLCSVEGYTENMLKIGVPVFVHTVNESDMINGYFADGISGVYTDNIINY
ncbi:MAG: hypothetical protein IKM46_07670 [Clostridia bacterium]|nr:hypothetical protein [Clostridia bacterium]